MRSDLGRWICVAFVVWFVVGCGTYDSVKDALDDDGGGDQSNIDPEEPPPPPEDPPPPDEETPPPPSPRQVPDDFAGVEWLHADVSGWAETASIDASIGGGTIRLDYDKARVWGAVDGLNANPWVFVFQDGRWYAATFEWFRFGQTSKPTSTVAGDHIKKPPLHNFRPRSGEVYGFMVSGLARDQKRNVRERTPVVMLRWP